MSFINWPNSNILANAAGLSTAICIGAASTNHTLTAAVTGGMAVYCAPSAFKDAMREVVREIKPAEAGSPVPEAAKPALNS
jgi:hypothetical protein